MSNNSNEISHNTIDQCSPKTMLLYSMWLMYINFDYIIIAITFIFIWTVAIIAFIIFVFKLQSLHFLFDNSRELLHKIWVFWVPGLGLTFLVEISLFSFMAVCYLKDIYINAHDYSFIKCFLFGSINLMIHTYIYIYSVKYYINCSISKDLVFYG